MSTPREIRRARKAGRSISSLPYGGDYCSCSGHGCLESTQCLRYIAAPRKYWEMLYDFAADLKPGQPCMYRMPLDGERT
jgi:hypothetical protein